MVSARDDLRVAVEDLNDEEAAEILLVVRRLKAIAAWDAAPPDDEEESAAELALVEEARLEIARGQTVPWDEVKRKLQQQRE
jgi:hypothetical protein